MTYLPWIAGGAALGYAARRGRRASRLPADRHSSLLYHCGSRPPGTSFKLEEFDAGESHVFATSMASLGEGIYFATRRIVAEEYCQYADKPWMTIAVATKPLMPWRKGLTPKKVLAQGYGGVRFPIKSGEHYFAEVAIFDLDAIHIIQTLDMSEGSPERSWGPLGKRLHGRGRRALKVVHQGKGREGANRHLTRRSTGTLPTSVLLGLKGARGEHRLFEKSPTGAKEAARWKKFVESIRREGVREPVLIVVEWTDDLSPAMRRKLAGERLEEVEAFVYEGNHRIRAAQEAGLAEVPVEVSYFGHAERRKGLL